MLNPNRISPAERALNILQENLNEAIRIAEKTNFAKHSVDEIEDILNQIKTIKGQH